MNKKITTVYKTLTYILIIFIALLTIVLLISNKIGRTTNAIIRDFKERGEFVYKSEDTEYYKIKASYEYEMNLERVYSTSSSSDEEKIFTDKLIGTTGDVYITSTDPFGTFYTKWLSKNMRIGHCGIVYNDDATLTYEVFGNKKDNTVNNYENRWNSLDLNELIVIRKKSHINKKEISDWLDSKCGCKYNYFYFLNPEKRYYCTNLISKCYEETCGEITKSKIFVTGSSMINSDETFMIYYKERVNSKDTKYRVYFLSEE